MTDPFVLGLVLGCVVGLAGGMAAGIAFGSWVMTDKDADQRIK